MHRNSWILKPDSPNFSFPDNKRATVEDEEYARLLSRMDELEKEELEAENFDEYDELDEVDLKHQPSQLSGDHEVKNLEVWLRLHLQLLTC